MTLDACVAMVDASTQKIEMRRVIVEQSNRQLVVAARSPSSRFIRGRSALALAFSLIFVPPALAGGSAENVLLIIDPTSAASLHVGNHYQAARGIPDCNVLYMAPGAPDFPTFVDRNVAALFGELEARGIADHIDTIVVTPGTNFYVDVPAGMISDGCFPVRRFSISGAYSLAPIASTVLLGGPSTATNQYYRGSDEARAFDARTRWLGGSPTTSLSGERYFLGAMLGYSGSLGNTIQETLDMIDRSVAVDGTRPPGTFYFMQTTDPARSGPRHGTFPAAVGAIVAQGGMAEHLMAVMPIGRMDCLGIMTGVASPGIASANLTIQPGAFCDHLTSFAGNFSTSSQEKMSLWIGRGASGTWGTVEEPCNYAGKFPHARMHVFYFQGLSLGEAAFRSAGFRPYQGLLYGDPLTRPFAHLPTTKLAIEPQGAVAGTITLQPVARTLHPTALIAVHELYIDGLIHSGAVNQRKLDRFEIDTTALADGHHEMRVVSTDNTLVRSAGNWIGALQVNNRGRSVSLTPSTLAGDRTTAFSLDAAGVGGAIQEIRILQGGRVVAAGAGALVSLVVRGETLGAGSARLIAQAIFADGEEVRSAPITLDVADTASSPSGMPPVAFDVVQRVRADQPFVLILPATSDDPISSLTFNVITPPTQSTIPSGQSGSALLTRPQALASGSDACTFLVLSPSGASNIATVTLIYTPPPGVLPYLSSTTRGAILAGDTRALFLSDDQRLEVEADRVTGIAGAATSTTLRITSPTKQPVLLRFECEAATSGNVLQSIEALDWGTGAWTLLDSRPTAAVDTLAAFDITLTPSRFVQQVTREIRVRLRYTETSPTPLEFIAQIDRFRLLVQ